MRVSSSCSVLMRSFCASVARRAANLAHRPSMTAIIWNISMSMGSEMRATHTPPWRLRRSTRPVAASAFSASRTGVRDTLKRSASSASSSRAPGFITPLTMRSSSVSFSSSDSVAPLPRWRSRPRSADGSAAISGSFGSMACLPCCACLCRSSNAGPVQRCSGGAWRGDSERAVAGHGGAVHHAAVHVVVVRRGAVHGAAVVPHQQVAREPLVAVAERGRDGVRVQLGQQRTLSSAQSPSICLTTSSPT
jgi:hypothetical protein